MYISNNYTVYRVLISIGKHVFALGFLEVRHPNAFRCAMTTLRSTPTLTANLRLYLWNNGDVTRILLCNMVLGLYNVYLWVDQAKI